MAERKPLFLNDTGTDAYHKEIATTDTITVGGVTISTSAGIDFGGFKAKNVGTPTLDTDGATKGYVDAVATGLDWKASVRLKTTASLPAYTPAGTGVGKTLTANANGALSLDSISTANGDRVLVDTEGAHNGIYVVTDTGSAGTPWVLTRATDADQNSEVTSGMAVFVTEGSSYADSGWVLTTDDPITVDTTSLSFSQFTGTGAIIAGAGISKTGSTLDVELDAAADAQGAGSGGGSSGLEFDVSGAAGKLRVRVDGFGGLQRTASGLALEIDDTPDTLDVGAAGLKVVGVPSLFKINGTAVGANVTAANVDSLVDGNPITGLHFHGANKAILAVNEAIAVADPVAPSTVDDRVRKCRADTDAARFMIGIAETAQATVGNTARVVLRGGTAAGVLSGATPGDRYYVAPTGGLLAANTTPGSNNHVILACIAKNATDAWVMCEQLGKK
jgi:hypothetical protein